MITQSFDLLMKFFYYIVIACVAIVAISLLRAAIRLLFEMYYSKNLRYLRIVLPRSDSKLDKEKETKKDFKEKIGMMSMFYKAVHKLG